MVINKSVRSAIALLALSGALAACSSNSSEPARQPAGGFSTDGSVSVLEVTQKASVKVASVNGREITAESVAEIGRIGTVTRAEVAKVQLADGSLAHDITLFAKNEAVAVFRANADLSQVALASEFEAAGASIVMNGNKIGTMTVKVAAGDVVLAFGVQQDEAKQDEAKQDEAKQDEAKQDEAKQDEPKQDEAKQDEAKQDEAKQDEAKQDEAKQDEPKQDEAKQDEAKQDEAKQDEPKQDEAKQDEKK